MRKFKSMTALQRKSHLCIPFLGIARPQPQFQHSCVCELFIGIGLHISSAEMADRSWEYINRSQTHECGNWDCHPLFLFWEYLFRNFSILSLQCGSIITSLMNILYLCNKVFFADTYPIKGAATSF